MNLHWVDWAIIAVFFVFMTAVATYTRRYVRSVADFPIVIMFRWRVEPVCSAGFSSKGEFK